MGITIDIMSRRTGQLYRVNRFVEYNIDIDLEMDADQFDIVFSNPNGIYTGIFDKFDPISVNINDIGVMFGTIDTPEYQWDDSRSVIQVSGRDMMGILVDNDALPGTKYNVKPDRYIKDKCAEYGIKRYKLDPSIPAIKKLVIGVNESEISIMNNILMESRKRIWTIYDTLYMGDWAMDAKPTHRFTRGVPDSEAGIPIKSLKLRDSGLDLSSEVRIYGSMSDGSEKVVGVAKNDELVKQGVKKRRTLRSSNDDSSSKYSSNALREIRDGFRSGIELQIDIKTGDEIILPNTTAEVIDTVTKMNSVLFIKNVTYRKTLQDGGITSIKMIPDDTTFEVLWTHYGDKKAGSRITGLPSMSLDALLNARRGK